MNYTLQALDPPPPRDTMRTALTAVFILVALPFAAPHSAVATWCLSLALFVQAFWPRH